MEQLASVDQDILLRLHCANHPTLTLTNTQVVKKREHSQPAPPSLTTGTLQG